MMPRTYIELEYLYLNIFTHFFGRMVLLFVCVKNNFTLTPSYTANQIALSQHLRKRNNHK